MADRRYTTIASLVLVLATLLAGLLRAPSLASGEGPPQQAAPPEAATRPVETEGAGPRPSPEGGYVPLNLPRPTMPSAQPQSGLLAPGALPMSYWVWIASVEPTARCGYDIGGVLVNALYWADLYDLCESTNTGGWVKRTVDLSGASGPTDIFVISATNASNNSNLFVDDVRLDVSGPGIAGFANSGFEAGRNGTWIEYSSLNSEHKILNSGWPGTVRPHAGNWAVWLGGWLDEVGYIMQTIKLPYRVKLPIVLRQTTTTDPYEPNNTFAQAWGPLQSGSTYSAYLLQGEADKVDYYYFDLPALHSIEAWLTSIPAGSDYDLYLYDAAHVYLTSSTTIGTVPEHLLWANGTAQRYYLRVTREAGGSTTQAYALRVVFR